MTPESPDTILKIDQINTFYGQSHVLQGVALSIQKGEVVCSFRKEWRWEDDHAPFDHRTHASPIGSDPFQRH